MLTKQDIVARRHEILAIARRHGAHNLRLIGSVARGEQTSNSDVDFTAEFDEGRSLFDLGDLVAELREYLGTSVDVISARGLRPHWREHVMRESVPL